MHENHQVNSSNDVGSRSQGKGKNIFIRKERAKRNLLSTVNFQNVIKESFPNERLSPIYGSKMDARVGVDLDSVSKFLEKPKPFIKLKEVSKEQESIRKSGTQASVRLN